jgi:beta-1,4-mannosyltransferase
VTDGPVSPPEQPIRVLHLVPDSGGTTGYFDIIDDPSDAATRFDRFSWPRALRSDYEVLHIHWPERLFRGQSGVRRLIKPVALLLLLARLRLRKIPLVRTVHNVAPHESGNALERFLLRLIDRRTDLFIVLNAHSPVPPGRPVVHIPHPHYRPAYARQPRAEVVRGRLLYFGVIRPYKGVLELIAAFAAWDQPGMSLRIVGQPSAEMAGQVAAAADRLDAVGVRFGYVSDAELVAEVSAAELVVLPYLSMHNSGALLAALSLDRPVLAPRNAVNAALAEEVGPEWVQLYDGDLSAKVLAGAHQRLGERRSAAPDLAARSSARVHAQHVRAYRQALGSLSR